MPVIKGRASNKSAAPPLRFRDGDALLRNVIENAAVPTFLSDLNGDVVYANRAFADLLGYEPEECLKLGMTTIVHPDDLGLLRSQHGGVAVGKSSGHKAERRYLRKNGDVVWVLSSAAAMPDALGRPQFVSVQAVDIDRQKRAEAALAESERRWNFALESAGQGVWEANLVNHTIYYSRMWKIIRGFDPEQFVDTSEKAWLERVHPDDRERILDLIHRQDRGEIKREPFEYRERHLAGHYIWISSNGAAVEWAPDGTPTRMIGTDTDITRRKIAEGEKVELSRRLELALDVSQIGVYEENLSTGEMFWDGRLHDIYGLPRGHGVLSGADWENLLHPEDAAAAIEAIASAIKEKSTVKTKYRILRPDGEIRTIMSRGTYFEDDQSTPRFIGADWDITPEVALTESLRLAKQLAEARNVELEVAKARIENQSLHDALTGLPNRRYLDQILSRHTGGKAGSSVALLHIDLDRFKQINDTLGHVAGDAMLIHVARLLKVEVGGQHFVARVGGDEFVIVCFNEADTVRLAALADRIIAKIRQPVPYEGHFCRFGASVGIAIAMGADERLDVRRLLVDADVALHRAKGRGRNRHEFFSRALRDEIASTKRIADDILRGLEQHEFLPFYQPLFDANTLDVAGVEALVRWNHPIDGILSPVRFLKIAEDLNVLATIDRAILQQAMLDLDHWHGLGLDVPSVSVNVSFRRLSDDQLVPSLRDLKIRPGTVSFEFLESIFLDEFDDVVAWNIDAIKEMGIGIDIDDFGTGHTSIVSLLKLKPRRFKIDRQLIDPIARIPEQRRLVASIIDIGKSLGIKVVAEGVETMEQAKILRELGCDMLQGYAFARPMPAAQLTNWLGAEAWRTAS